MAEEEAPKKRPRPKKASAKSASGPNKESEAFDLSKTHTIEGFRELCGQVRKSLEVRRGEKTVVLEAIDRLKASRESLRDEIERESVRAVEALKERLGRLKDRLTEIEDELASIEEDKKKARASESSNEGKARPKKKAAAKKTQQETALVAEHKKTVADANAIENELKNDLYGKRHGFHAEVELNNRIHRIETYARTLDEASKKHHEVLAAYENYAELLCQKHKTATDRLLSERRNIVRWEKKRESKAQVPRTDEERRIEEELVDRQEENLRKSLKMLAREMLSVLGMNLSVTRYVRSDFCPRCRSEKLRMLSTGGAMECLRCGHWQPHVDAASQTGGSFFFASTGNFGGTTSTSCGADSSCVGNANKEESGLSGLSASRQKAGGRIIARVFELCNMEQRLSQESMDKAEAIVRKAYPDLTNLTYRNVVSALKAAKQETLCKHAVQIACRMLNKSVPKLTESEIDTLATMCEILQQHREFLKEKKERNNVIWSTLVNIQQLYVVKRPDLICFLDPIKTPSKIAAVEEELKICYEKAFNAKYHYARDIVAAIDCPRVGPSSNLLDYGEAMVWNDSTTKRAAPSSRKAPAKKQRKDDDEDEPSESEEEDE